MNTAIKYANENGIEALDLEPADIPHGTIILEK